MRWATIAALVPAVLAGAVLLLVAAGLPPFDGGSERNEATAAPAVPRPKVDRFDSARAFRHLRMQVAMGPRPAGSTPSRRLAAKLRRALPAGRFQPVPGGLRNVIGRIPGRTRRVVVVGAHYDTKDIPGFLGANDGASGTATVVELARTIRPRQLRPTVVFILFDGEEAPAGTPEGEFELRGLRGSRAAAPRYRHAAAMVLLDFVGERGLRIPREALSDATLWAGLRASARAVGVGRVFPDERQGPILDDHLPFIRAGVPAINLIDFDFPCWHRRCDDLSAVSERSLDAVGETIVELLRRL